MCLYAEEPGERRGEDSGAPGTGRGRDGPSIGGRTRHENAQQTLPLSGRDGQGWGAHARATAFSSPAGGAGHD